MSLKVALRQGKKPLFGPFIYLPSPEVVEMAGIAGFDFVVIDLEHGAYDLEACFNLARSAKAADILSIVRVPSIDAPLIGRILDFGCDAILVPHIDSPGSAQQALAAAKYPPAGSRGAYPYSRAARYSDIPPAVHQETANEQTTLILLLEGMDAINNLEAILVQGQPDMVFLGPVDLSFSLGIPGQLDHPLIESTIRNVLETCGRHGVATGIFASSPEAASRYAGWGIDFIGCSSDSYLIFNSFKGFRRAINNGGGAS